VPVIDGVFVPRSPLTLAERQADFAAIDAHVLERRVRVEEAVLPLIRRLGVLANTGWGLLPLPVLDAIEERLRMALDRTATFGYRQAQSEIRSLRRAKRLSVRSYAIPDAGEYARLAAGGIESIRVLIRRRSREVAYAVNQAVVDAAGTPGLDPTTRTLAIANAGRRALHNNVLELVGETLNMGRTAGAMAIPTPPEFAMRSEQLDKATCPECERLQGEITQIGSSDYFALLPPSGCLGGGRCRGVMVFGDGPVDFRVPIAEAA